MGKVDSLLSYTDNSHFGIQMNIQVFFGFTFFRAEDNKLTMVVTKTKTSISEDQFAKTNKSSRCNTIGTNLRVIGDNLERRFQLRLLLQKPRQENNDRHLKTAIRFAVMKVLLAMIILWDWNSEECYLLRDWGSRDWSHGKRKFTFNFDICIVAGDKRFNK